MQRIAVLVSGGGTNLEALLNAKEQGAIPHGEFVLVVASKPGVYALERAANHKVPGAVVCRKDYPSTQAFDQALLDLLAQYKVDVIVLAGYLSILSERLVKAYEKRIINVHPALIPSFCGAGFYGLKVHQAALDYGVKVTGATVHFVNEIPDGGEIIFQKAVDVLEGDTPETLQKRVMEQAEWILLPKAVEQVTNDLETKR